MSTRNVPGPDPNQAQGQPPQPWPPQPQPWPPQPQQWQPASAPPPLQPKRTSNSTILALLILVPIGPIVVVMVVCLWGRALFDARTTNQQAVNNEVSIVSCSEIPGGVFYNFDAEILVKNTSNGLHHYVIAVEFLHGSDRVAHGTVTVDNLGAGHSARETVKVLITETQATKCAIAGVNRN